jgi:hypothetical protein
MSIFSVCDQIKNLVNEKMVSKSIHFLCEGITLLCKYL